MSQQNTPRKEQDLLFATKKLIFTKARGDSKKLSPLLWIKVVSGKWWPNTVLCDDMC